MSKVFYGGLFAAVVMALALAPGCKGGKKKADEDVTWEAGCGCTAEACACGEEACGCAGSCGCGEACGAEAEAEPACGCTAEACACGEGCGCDAGCGCGETCGAEAEEPEAAKTACGCEAGCGAEPCAACGGCGCKGGEACGCGGEEACGCGGCGCGDAAMISDADARHAMRLYRRYLIWGKANAKRFKSKPHKLMITNYVNKIGQDSWKKGSGGYPAGSSVAKEGWKDDQRAMVFFMEKRAAGFDADNGDWWYATIDGKGKIVNAGKVQSCIDCHVNASNDYVFGNPK